MIGFCGRFGAKQYIPNKPTKYGVKAFTLADNLNDYILDILVYAGADTLQNAHYISTNASTSKNCSVFNQTLARLHLQRNLSRAVPGRPFRRSFTEENFSGYPERLNKTPHF